MEDKDLIASFLANKGATVVPAGATTMTPTQMKRKLGYEPEKTYRFEVMLQGEDGMEFMEIISAANRPAAREIAEEQFPESRVITVEKEGSREERIYRSVW